MSIEYAWEAQNYLLDNGRLVEDLFQKIESLRDGIPSENVIFTPNVNGIDLFTWEIARHWVGFTLDAEAKHIRVVLIKPMPSTL